MILKNICNIIFTSYFMLKYFKEEILTENGYYLLEQIDEKVKIKKSKGLGLKLFFRVEFRDNYGRATNIPWNLDFRSRILNYFIDVFPPNGSSIKRFYLNENDELCILYEELEDFDSDVHFYPFNLDKKSEWLATFNFFEQTWQLKRIRYLK